MTTTSPRLAPPAGGTLPPQTPPDGPGVRVRGVRYPVRLPKLSDPRLHVAAVVVSVQVLGQVSLGFELSVAQILVSLLTAGIIDGVITLREERAVAWPASALLSGNGIALILRVPGTEHGDWWSMRGWYIFAATSALAVLSKHVIRVGGRPLFNPSNLALVVAFLVLGVQWADPQDLWWGPMSAGLVLTYAVISVGGLLITRRLGLLALSASFWVTFAGLMGLLAVLGHSMSARWSTTPVDGARYWTTLALSPEILVFLFFMITDPRTATRGRAARVLYGVGVAVACSLLISLQTTEYATKVALLSGLVLVCAGRPLLERLAPSCAPGGFGTWARQRRRRPVVLGVAAVATVLGVAGGSAVAGEPTAVAEVDAPGIARPAVALADDQRPEVTVSEDAVEADGDLAEPEVAEAVGQEVVEDVLIADRAVAEGDEDVVAAVAAGRWLAEVTERVEAGGDGSAAGTDAAGAGDSGTGDSGTGGSGADGPGADAPAAVAASVPARTFESASIDVHRDPGNFQAIPRLTVTLAGTLDGEPWEGTYQVVRTDAGALVVDDLSG